MENPSESHLDTQIRWMIRRDLPTLLEIEKASFEFPWTEEDFIRSLRQRNCIGMVADNQDEVLGFMVYELYRSRIHLVNLAVHPDRRREGIGSAMINKLISKLGSTRRSRISLEVRETNIHAQFFFRALGFKAIGLLKNFYEDTPEDAYMMQFRTDGADSPFTSNPGINRMAG